MSGRQARARSQGGRGGGRSQYKPRRYNRDFSSRKQSKNKKLTDYNYYLGSSKQASDYETTTQFLINHIKKTYDHGLDVATALTSSEPIDTEEWKPSLNVSMITGDDEISVATREAETKEYDMIFKQEYSDYSSR